MFLTTIELIVAILITDIYYVFTLAPAVNIQKMLQTSKFCQQHPKIVTNLKSQIALSPCPTLVTTFHMQRNLPTSNFPTSRSFATVFSSYTYSHHYEPYEIK